MLIKLTPPASAAPTPTILFALSFQDLPPGLPVPAAWAAQIARLAADDLEAPPSQHALDRAAALPSLLGEVLFDLPGGRVACTFLDGASEELALDARCAEMLARVIQDVEDSGKAEERAREWQRTLEAERAREQKEQEQTQEQETEKEREREAEMERDYERDLQKAKGKGKEQILNSPPASLKGSRPKSRLHRSRSLLMALVATFSSNPSSSSPQSSLSFSPSVPASAPATRSSFSGSTPRSPSPLRAFARRASFSALSAVTRGDSPSASASSSSPSTSTSPARPTARPPSPPSLHNLETPPASAPPSAPSSAFAKQQNQLAPIPSKALAALLSASREQLSPRALRRRARSTLVDAFRAHVLPELGARVGLFEPARSSPLPLRAEEDTLKQGVPSGSEDEFGIATPSAPGGGYYAWVARSMLRRAEKRMRELEDEWPALTSPTRSSRRSNSVSAHSQSPHSLSYPPFSPTSISFPVSPTSSTSPRHATFEPWSSDESESDEDSESDGEFGGAEGDSEGSGTDGSSVHTPESGHSIGYGHGLDASTSTTSSYFTCSDAAEAEETEPAPTASHIRRAAQSSPLHSRSASAAHPSRRPSSSSQAASKQLKQEQRERKRAQRTAKVEHVAFTRMTARLRQILSQAAAARGMAKMQKDESERVREDRGVRRGWLEGGKAALGAPVAGAKKAEAFRPSGLGRWVWDAVDVMDDGAASDSESADDRPPAYEDVVSEMSQMQGHRFALHASKHAVHRTRASQPIHRTRTTLAHLDDLDLEVDLEHLELDAAELEGLDIDVDLEHLELTDSLDVDAMGLDVDVDTDMGFDVFADVGGKGRGKGRRLPVNGKGRREVWERRRMGVAI
ncbi:hypothetical protein DFH09DRAFT_562433 [Mycena vulgaris]|nr:hypothetical protein DFH09DRAFT_562433 [Mycena vulgaris]